MNEMLIQENLDKFIDVLNQIKTSNTDSDGLLKISSFTNDLKSILDKIFIEYGYKCTDVLYTLNTDNEYFGVIVSPNIDGVTAFKIFATGEAIRLSSYKLELDSRLFNCNLTSEELASIILFEISSTLDPNQINNVRALIDLHVLSDDDVIHLRDSINYNQLIAYAIKDTLRKVSSIIYKDDEDDILSNSFIITYKLQDPLVSAQEKLINDVFGQSDTLSSPKTYILQWVYNIYSQMKGYAVSSIDTLKDAKNFTASKLLKLEIDKTIDAISKATGTPIKEELDLNKFFESKSLYSLNELGLFKSLKSNGLRSIEDDYYELAIQVKALETEADAIHVLRSINSRLSILEDYIYNNELKESERKRWLIVAKMYRELRNTILEKKINKRKYQDIFNDPLNYE